MKTVNVLVGVGALVIGSSAFSEDLRSQYESRAESAEQLCALGQSGMARSVAPGTKIDGKSATVVNAQPKESYGCGDSGPFNPMGVQYYLSLSNGEICLVTMLGQGRFSNGEYRYKANVVSCR